MEYYLPLEVTLMSAEGIAVDDPYSSPDVEVFAVVALVAGDCVFALQRTPTVSAGGGGGEQRGNPAWNFAVRFSIPLGGCDCKKLCFDLWCKCSRGDRGVGRVEVAIVELLRGCSSAAAAGGAGGPRFLSRYVTSPRAGARSGVLTFMYEFLEIEASWSPLKPVPLLEWIPSTKPCLSPPPPPVPSSTSQESERPSHGQGDCYSPTPERASRCSLLPRWWWAWLALAAVGWKVAREMLINMASEMAYERMQRGLVHDLQHAIVLCARPRPAPPPSSPATAAGIGLLACGVLLFLGLRIVKVTGRRA